MALFGRSECAKIPPSAGPSADDASTAPSDDRTDASNASRAPEVTHEQIESLTRQIAAAGEAFQQLRAEIGRAVVGQERLVHHLLIGLLTGGHLLIEGVPGLAKTTAAAALAQAISGSFQRLQFTPDLLPADLLGTLVYRPQDQRFEIHKGPIFANFVLADEINRAPAKVQSALLEAMQERQVTIGSETFPLPRPFLVLATQNPIEQQGTYPLPEAQMDRFMLKFVVRYPRRHEELEILDRAGRLADTPRVNAVISPADLELARSLVDQIYLDQRLKDYIVDLVMVTRDPHQYGADLSQLIQYGASPRGTISLALASKANAFLNGRGYTTPEDVRALAPSVLRHRIILSYEAEAESVSTDDVIRMILDAVPVP